MNKKMIKINIIDVDKIRRQMESSDMSINQMARAYNIPYATLYRAIKGREVNADSPEVNEATDGPKKE